MEEAVTFWDIPPPGGHPHWASNFAFDLFSGWNNVTRILDRYIAMYLDPDGLATTQGK